ncbi:ABC transporter ATP-binding protein [Halalkalibacter urbisdiaboli]|uniref:ABC transporter ATP-binding protein n=1 Tax=Halalkalibacter urbisdiaboli TaxID=1960589 RepID=UPI0013FD4DCC|nr:ABC transporter ATP-binding protein [Halalkalibacter urbisdiaboli]
MSKFISQLIRLSKDRTNIYLYLVAAIFVGISDVTLGYVIKELTDLRDDALTEIWYYVCLLVIVAVFGTFFKYVTRYVSGKFCFKYIQKLREQLSTHIMKLSVPQRDQVNAGEFVSKLSNDINQLQQFLQGPFFQLLYQPIIFLLTFTFLIFMSWKLVIMTLVIVPVTLFLANKISKPISGFRKRESEIQSNMLTIAQDSIDGIHMERAYNLQSIFNQKYDHVVKELVHFMLKREKRQALLTPFQMIIHIVPLLICSIYGGYLAINGQLTAGELFAFVFLVQYLIDPLAMIPSLIGGMRTADASFQRIKDVLALPIERKGGNEEILQVESSEPVIEFSQVSFQYENGVHVLHDISFKINRNQTVALVGSSGSGKSTTLQLVCGLYEQQKGDIYLYGNDMRKLHLQSVREKIAMVSQDTYLFPGTIAENISYGNPHARFDEIVEVAKAACIHDFIIELPQGYQTLVGERGYNLSGGQKQRLSIARALLKPASILLLDEATSALDHGLETSIQSALDEYAKKRTTLVIAHRLSTVIKADEILVFDNGTIVERGTHEDLIKNGIRYRALYEKQFSEELLEEAQ